MSYRKTYSRLFFNEEFDPHILGPGHTEPIRCPDHIDPNTGRGWCFRCKDESLSVTECGGNWRMLNPLDIRTEMPGVSQKLLMITCESAYWGKKGWGGFNAGFIKVYADGAEIYKSSDLVFNREQWTSNKFVPAPIDISTRTQLELEIHQHSVCRIPEQWVASHIAQVKIDCEYYVDVAPPTAEVEIHVANKQTGNAVKNAYTALMSGPVIEAEGYTDGTGKIVFSNIYEGSYTLLALASNYRETQLSINVSPPKVIYTLNLVPIPTQPIPWYVWAVAAGGIALGSVVVVKSLGAKGQRFPILVVK